MNAESLKKSILQWAIEGKLVPQLENEVAVNQIGEAPEDVPFAIPKKWKWMRFGDLGVLSSPRRVHKSDWKSEGVPFLRARELAYLAETGKLLNELFIDPELFEARRKKGETPEGGDLLLTAVGTLGKCYVVKDDDVFFCKDTNTLRFAKHNQSPYFLQLLFQSPYIRALIDRTAVGSTVKNLTIGVMNKWLIPVPPIEEQHRIVERLNELLPLVDTYGKEYEALMKLNKELPGRLRASILQEAIQGKLVPQIDEEPSVEQIGVPPEDVPFAIPEKWKWVTIGSVCEYIQRGKSPRYSDIQEIPVVAQKCNQWDGFHIEKAKFIDPETADSYKKERWLQEGDVLWNSTGLGTLGRVALYEEHLNPYGRAVADSHVTVLRSSNLIYSKYLYFYICSPTIQSIVEEISSGSTKQKELATTTIKNLFIPLPPILEQHRIVDRIVQLLDDVKDLV